MLHLCLESCSHTQLEFRFVSFSYYLLLRRSIVAQKQNQKERKTRWERLWSLQGLYDTFHGKRTISAPKSVSQNSNHIIKKSIFDILNI